jgi:FkbM family methyltransferase
LNYVGPLDVGLASRKFHLEGLLLGDPNNRSLLDAYFGILECLSDNSFGLLYASLPGYRAPLFFRGMKTDLLNMRQIFWHDEYGFEFSERPRRILDLGAYGGYSAVYLANRFPDAEIVCIEPSPTNFRLLSINTEPYENIKRLLGAVWHRSAQLDLIERVGGDWGSVFGEHTTGTAARVQAYTVPEILRFAGWPSADYIKCDIEGSEVELFSDASVATDWLSGVSCISVETHDRFKPGCTEAVKTALPADKYHHSRNGEFHIFTPLSDHAGMATHFNPSAERILLIPEILRPRRFERMNVLPQPWGFCMIDDETFQLHPKPPGQGRSEVRFPLDLSAQQCFSAQCSLPHESEWPVMFSVSLTGNGGTEFNETRIVSPGDSIALQFIIPERIGYYRLGLGTEMVPGARTNGFAWARWTNPCLQ